MSILVNTHNEQEEKLLIAFLNNHRYDYKSDIAEEEAIIAFINEYNIEIDKAEAEIESGNYIDHDEVEKQFANRRKNLNGD
jgi:predicted transcriptional regulator